MKHPHAIRTGGAALALAALAWAAMLLGGPAPAGARQTRAAARAVGVAAVGHQALAPEFPPGAAWLNTDRPLSLRALRGKVVLLDFWTYGCIDCMHILPDLRRLERKYPNELVIIGIHSAKFINEDDTANIRNAVLRYNIEHPVLNDQGLRMWTAYGVDSWPTLVLIDPDGHVVGGVSGEGHFAAADRAVGELVRRFRAAGRLDATPARFALEAARVPVTPLWYPGKVLAAAAGGSGPDYLFIADSNHNRVVIARTDGTVQAVAGTGAAGFHDGAFDAATFRGPQGMALRRGADGALTLLVADTNNHAVRALDLKRGVVTTLAGTGSQAPLKARGGAGARTPLSSPWDLQLISDRLYIAMAGPHQVWSMNLASGIVGPYAGSGEEGRRDGALGTAAFAQPSGLATDGHHLFVADSESSSVREVDLPGGHQRVRTLAGGDLFVFGDHDGTGDAARFQHPLGVAYASGLLYLTDTYNHKIKTLDPASGLARTFLGGGRGQKDGGQPQFYEPGGLSILGNRLYVADTDNHQIRVVDLTTRSATTLPLKGLSAALPAEPERPVQPAAASAGDTVTLPPAAIAPGARGELVLEVALPPGHHLNVESPHRFEAQVEGEGVTLSTPRVEGAGFRLPLRVPITSGKSGTSGAVLVTATIFYCSDVEGTCKMKRLRLRAPFTVREGGEAALTLHAALQ